MDSPDIGKIFGYGIAIISFSAGLLLLTGLLPFDTVPSVRNTFAVVLVLMGIYRFVITHYKPTSSRWRRFTNNEDE
jgi:hypothetical protein